MPADTTTPIFGFLLQGTGNNPNSWGTNLNDSVITPIENAIGGCLTIGSLTGGAYSLTQANALYGTIILQGTLASDLVITVPSTANNWRFINELVTAGFYVLIKTSGNTAVNIPHGKLTEITCDGTDMHRHDAANVGELFYHAAAGSTPGGSIECEGTARLRLSLVDLFASIGTDWGVGNGTTTFGIPDGYTAGKFLRSRTASVTIGTAQTNQNKAHTHGYSGSTNDPGNHTHVNTLTDLGHTHVLSSPLAKILDAGTLGSFAFTGGSSSAPTLSVNSATTGVTINNAAAGAHTHTYSGTTVSDGGTEARPENISARLCIRY